VGVIKESQSVKKVIVLPLNLPYNMHNFDLRMHFWERGAYYFLKNYQNVIIVPAAVALLLEQHNSREQQLSISLTTIKLWCHPQSPAVILTTHTLTILGIHIAHLAYIKLYSSHTVRFSSPAFGRYIGPPMATSNTLRNIQTRCRKRHWHCDEGRSMLSEVMQTTPPSLKGF